MKIYLVRHGQANSEKIDPEKGLSDQGKADIARLAESIRQLAIEVAEIRQSGKARAEQTARILAQVVKSERGIIRGGGLEPADPVAGVAGELRAAGEDIMLVGHLPFMAKLGSYLLTGADHHGILEFNPGAIACFEHVKGKCMLLWFIDPGIVPPDQPGQFRSYH